MVPFKKGQLAKGVPNDSESQNITANIIFNLAHLGISIEDTKNFDLETYFEIVGLEMNVINGKQSSKRATQSDIDNFYL
ncbi:MAG: hypothetical protein KKH01_08200 [Firmicutes bacterium]|nr:hypothetical protein [Bacillota bacterium]